MRILLVSEQSAGIETIRVLQGSGHELRAVLSSAFPSATGGATVAGVAVAAGIELLPARLVADPDFAGWIETERIDLLLNVFSLLVAEAAVVAAPRLGSFNLHPSPLPDYAGLNSPCWAIYHGEPSHGVTWHRMDEGIDTGSIAYQTVFPLDELETGLTLATRCIREGLALLPRLLEDASRAEIPSVPQNRRGRRYFSAAPPQGGRIVWDRPARSIERFVRACDFGPFPSPWGRPRAEAAGRPLELLKVAVTGHACRERPGTPRTRPDGAVEVATGDEWLQLKAVRVDGRKAAPDAAVRGVDRLGDG